MNYWLVRLDWVQKNRLLVHVWSDTKTKEQISPLVSFLTNRYMS